MSEETTVGEIFERLLDKYRGELMEEVDRFFPEVHFEETELKGKPYLKMFKGKRCVARFLDDKMFACYREALSFIRNLREYLAA